MDDHECPPCDKEHVEDLPSGPVVVEIYAGSLVRPAGPATFRYGAYVQLFENGAFKMDLSMYGMASLQISYSGTYTVEENTVKFTYVVVDGDGVAEEEATVLTLTKVGDNHLTGFRPRFMTGGGAPGEDIVLVLLWQPEA